LENIGVYHLFLATLALLFRCTSECGPLAHAPFHPAAGDSTHIVAVDRLDQFLNAVQADEVRSLENEEFFAQGMATCLRVAFQIFAPEL
jgi:hypothetical protein